MALITRQGAIISDAKIADVADDTITFAEVRPDGEFLRVRVAVNTALAPNPAIIDQDAVRALIQVLTQEAEILWPGFTV